MEKNRRRFHEVVIMDDPEQRRRVVMEEGNAFYVMVIEANRHGAERFEKDRLHFIEEGEKEN